MDRSIPVKDIQPGMQVWINGHDWEPVEVVVVRVHEVRAASTAGDESLVFVRDIVGDKEYHKGLSPYEIHRTKADVLKGLINNFDSKAKHFFTLAQRAAARLKTIEEA